MKKQFRITLNNKSYDVVAEIIGEEEPIAMAPRSSGRPARAAAAAVAVAAPAPAAPKAAAAAPAAKGDIPSPLAGKVVSIDCKVGQAVKAGEKVITLEAMKMNTEVTAPADGTIQAVHVAPGDSVEEGQALMSIA